MAGRDVMVSRPCSSTLLWACQGQLGPETSGMNPSCSPIRAGRQDNPRNAHLPPTNIRGGPKAASDMDASPARNITAEVSSASATDRSSSRNIRVGMQTTLHVSPSFNKDLGHSCQIQIPGPRLRHIGFLMPVETKIRKTLYSWFNSDVAGDSRTTNL